MVGGTRDDGGLLVFGLIVRTGFTGVSCVLERVRGRGGLWPLLLSGLRVLPLMVSGLWGGMAEVGAPCIRDEGGGERVMAVHWRQLVMSTGEQTWERYI